MGGAVAMSLAARHAHQRLKCVADRTFSRLPLVVSGALTGTCSAFFVNTATNTTNTNTTTATTVHFPLPCLPKEQREWVDE
jgi:hypothetical protein